MHSRIIHFLLLGQVRHLTGRTANPSCLQRLTHVVYNYRPDMVTKIDSIQAVHLGTDFLVEVDIGLPGSMPLATAHDIGAELQTQLETIDDVERAFVHLDFEFEHMPPNEHKTV
jgi:divalent metal cation (Fe/Co/Zn/Cd) transporter